MAGKYQRNTTSPNNGHRKVKHAFKQRAGGKSSECISRMPDGSVYLFSPNAKERNTPVTHAHSTGTTKVAEVQRMAAIVGYIGNVE